MMMHEFKLRVYYEDTDLAGIVYYANYLKFIERARSTLVREAGIDQLDMQENGLVFAVRNVVADYHLSAHLNDELSVTTKLQQLSGAKIIFEQCVYLDEKLLFSSLITVACVTNEGRASRIPADIKAKLQQFAA